MAIDTNSLQTFTDAELLLCYRHALATGAFRTTMSINGRTIQVPGPKDVLEVLERLEGRVASDDGTGGMNALVRYGERV